MSHSLTEVAQLWQMSLARIKEKIDDKPVFDSFFSETYIYNIKGDIITIVTNSKLAKMVVSERYIDLVNDVISDITETNYKVNVIDESELVELKSKEVVQTKKVSYFKDSTIQPDLTFSNFVVGTFNREASQASVFVASNPGKQFNPLFIHSNSGLGKTHLLHAIGSYIKTTSIPGAKILYITANDFVEEYIKFVKGEKEAESLKDYISSFDVLLLDDIQFLANKPKTEEMFFYVYEKMINNNKQIVITSDKQPNELNGLEDRLVSRFSKGLVVQINEPDPNSCVEILKKKISARDLDINDFDEDVLTFFADKFSKNVRELEGALNRLIFYVVTFKPQKHISLDIACEAVESLVGGKPSVSVLTEQKIINAVADYYNLPPSQIVGKIRTGQIALARHISMYLIRTILDKPLKKIGTVFGGKDHTTVMSAIDKVEKGLKTDEGLKTAINELKKRLTK